MMADGAGAANAEDLELAMQVNDAAPPIDRLPEEVLGAILDRLPLDDKLFTLPKVCRRWKALAQLTSCCWQSIDLSQIEGTCDHSRCPEQAAVYSCAFPDFLRLLARRSQGNPHTLVAPRIDSRSLTIFLDGVVQGSLRLLSIRRSDISDEWVAQYAPKLRGLRALKMRGCHNITHQGIATLGKSCPSLQCLVLSQHSEEVFFAIAAHMAALTHLHVVDFDRRAGGGSSILSRIPLDGLLRILHSCSHLRWLCFSDRHQSNNIYFQEPPYSVADLARDLQTGTCSLTDDTSTNNQYCWVPWG